MGESQASSHRKLAITLPNASICAQTPTNARTPIRTQPDHLSLFSYQMKQHGTDSDGRGVLRDHHSSVIAATLPVTVVGGKERCQHVVMAYHTLPPPPQNVVPATTAITIVVLPVNVTVVEHGEEQ